MGVESSVRDDTQMKEQRRDRIISISTNTIYREQCKLVSGLKG